MNPPPFFFEKTIAIDNLCMEIAEMVGSMHSSSELSTNPKLRRALRIKTIYSSLVTEGNSLSEDEVIAILDDKKVLGKSSDILEVENASLAYSSMNQLNPFELEDLLKIHSIMMSNLVQSAGNFRNSNVGVFDGDRLIHAGTPAHYVPMVMKDLFEWLKSSNLHPLLKSCLFHYEFEFIHPFEDGNGRVGRLWNTLLLSTWKPALAWLPVESVILKRQADYYAAINESNNLGNSAPFVQYTLEAIKEALEPYVEGKESRQEARQRTLLQLVCEQPAISTPAIADTLGISISTTERLLSTLKKEALR